VSESLTHCFRRKKKCVRYLQGEDADCKDGRCDADGENHKPSCPAAHEPGCSVRGSDCDCNTHTCGKVQVKKEEKDCTCRKEDGVKDVAKATPNVAAEKDLKDNTLHLASVANLSLTREASVTNLPRDPAPRIDTNMFNPTQFRQNFEGSTVPAPRVFPTMDYTIPSSSSVSVLSHYPSNR